jgi:hypothetical protein
MILGAPKNEVKVNAFFGNNYLSQKAIENALPAAIQEVKPALVFYRQSGPYLDGLQLWSFLKKNVQYEVDSHKLQVIRLPKFLLSSKKGDCKSLTLYAAAYLIAAGYQVAIVYASYDAKDKTPTHVYLYFWPKPAKGLVPEKNLLPQSGKYYILDAVINKYNHEVPYKHRLVKIVNTQ